MHVFFLVFLLSLFVSVVSSIPTYTYGSMSISFDPASLIYYVNISNGDLHRAISFKSAGFSLRANNSWYAAGLPNFNENSEVDYKKLTVFSYSNAFENTIYHGQYCSSFSITLISEDSFVNVTYSIHACGAGGPSPPNVFFTTVFNSNIEGTTVDECTDEAIPCETKKTLTQFPAFELVKPDLSPYPDKILQTSKFEGIGAKESSGPGIISQGSISGPYMFHFSKDYGGVDILFGSVFDQYDDVCVTGDDVLPEYLVTEGNKTDGSGLSCGAQGFLNHIKKGTEISFAMIFHIDKRQLLLSWSSLISSLANEGKQQVNDDPYDKNNRVLSNIGYWLDEDCYYNSDYFNHVNTTIVNLIRRIQKGLDFQNIAVGYFSLGVTPLGSSYSFLRSMDEFTVNQKILGASNFSEFLGIFKQMPFLFTIPPISGYNDFGTCPELENFTVYLSKPISNPDYQGSIPETIFVPSASCSKDFWNTLFNCLFGGYLSTTEHSLRMGGIGYATTSVIALLQEHGSRTMWLKGLSDSVSKRGSKTIIIIADVTPADIITSSLTDRILGISVKSVLSRIESPVKKEETGLLSLASSLNLSVMGSAVITTDHISEPQARAALAVMTKGFDGIGDRSCRTDPTLIDNMMMESGTLLRPTVPAMEVGAAFKNEPTIDDDMNDVRIESNINSDSNSVTLMSSSSIPSSVNGDVKHYYQVMFSKTTEKLEEEIFGREEASTLKTYRIWSPSCCNNCSVINCLGDPFNINPPADGISFWQIVPFTYTDDKRTKYFAFLGEADKFIAVSPDRFTSIRLNSNKKVLTLNLKGSPFERVIVLYAYDNLVHNYVCEFGNSNTYSCTISLG